LLRYDVLFVGYCKHLQIMCWFVYVMYTSALRVYCLLLRTVENRGKKNPANFCENRKSQSKDTASHHGPEDHYTVFKKLNI